MSDNFRWARQLFFPEVSARVDKALDDTYYGGFDNQTSGVQPPPATVPVTQDVDAAREGQVAAARARLQRRAEREAVSGVKPTYYDTRAHLRTRQLDQMGPRGPIVNAMTAPEVNQDYMDPQNYMNAIRKFGKQFLK